jgi:hypothetical protein
MEGGTPEGNRIFGARYDPPDHLRLSVFFTRRLRAKRRAAHFSSAFDCVQRIAIPK